MAVWETESFTYRLKVLKKPINVLNFWVCASFSYTKNWNWLLWTNLKNLISWYLFSKIPQILCKKFQIVKTALVANR